MVKTVGRLAILLALSALAGCGVYTFNPSGQSDFETMAVQRFQNETAELELADRITDLVIDALIADGTFDVVPENQAEVVLTGTLTNYERKAFEYDQNDNVQSWRVVMDFRITLMDSSDESEILSDLVSQQGVYNVDTETEEDAQEEAVDRLVEQILTRTTKSW
jgi:hypothetical protein